MKIKQSTRERLEQLGLSEWNARTTITKAENPSLISLPWMTVTVSVKEHTEGWVLAVATDAAKQGGQSLLAAFPLPPKLERGDTPIETLVAFLDLYGVDLDLGHGPTRLVMSGSAGMPFEDFKEWVVATMQGMRHLKHDLELVSSTRVADGDVDIAILFVIDTTALKKDL